MYYKTGKYTVDNIYYILSKVLSQGCTQQNIMTIIKVAYLDLSTCSTLYYFQTFSSKTKVASITQSLFKRLWSLKEAFSENGLYLVSFLTICQEGADFPLPFPRAIYPPLKHFALPGALPYQKRVLVLNDLPNTIFILKFAIPWQKRTNFLEGMEGGYGLPSPTKIHNCAPCFGLILVYIFSCV